MRTEHAERLNDASELQDAVTDYMAALDKFRQPYRQTAANAPSSRQVKQRKAARLWKAEQHLRELVGLETASRYVNNMDVLEDGPSRYLDRQPESRPQCDACDRYVDHLQHVCHPVMGCTDQCCRCLRRESGCEQCLDGTAVPS